MGHQMSHQINLIKEMGLRLREKEPLKLGIVFYDGPSKEAKHKT